MSELVRVTDDADRLYLALDNIDCEHAQDLHIDSFPFGIRADAGLVGGLGERNELLKVNIGAHKREPLLDRQPLGLAKRGLGRTAQQIAGLAVDPDPPTLKCATRTARLNHGGDESGDQRGADQVRAQRVRPAVASSRHGLARQRSSGPHASGA
jgi:hypothetical protein